MTLTLHWEKNRRRAGVPYRKIKAAVKHREYWISHSAVRLLERIQGKPAGDKTGAPVATPTEKISPAETPVNLPAAGFDILADLLGDRDRDLRLAAAETFSRLREKRAAAVLAKGCSR